MTRLRLCLLHYTLSPICTEKPTWRPNNANAVRMEVKPTFRLILVSRLMTIMKEKKGNEGEPKKNKKEEILFLRSEDRKQQ